MNNDALIHKIERLECRIAEMELSSRQNPMGATSRVKKRMAKRVLIPFGIISFLVAATITFAASIPNSFTAGDPISSSQMNDNFSYIIEQLNNFSAPGSAYSNNGAAPASSVHVASSGYVGIGTSSPGQKLEVSGNQKVTGNLSVSGSIIGSADYIWIQDEKPSGTESGTFTSGAWQTRDLNTEKSDSGGHASISSNQIILSAGTYRVSIVAPAYDVGFHQSRIYNVSDGSTIIAGTSAYTPGTNQSTSFIRGEFSLSNTKTLELQHRCFVTKLIKGYGSANSFGEAEVYAIVELWRIRD